jgi:hypothetical protein
MLKGLSELKIDRSLLVIYPPLLARLKIKYGNIQGSDFKIKAPQLIL